MSKLKNNNNLKVSWGFIPALFWTHFNNKISSFKQCKILKKEEKRKELMVEQCKLASAINNYRVVTSQTCSKHMANQHKWVTILTIRTIIYTIRAGWIDIYTLSRPRCSSILGYKNKVWSFLFFRFCSISWLSVWTVRHICFWSSLILSFQLLCASVSKTTIRSC